MSWIQDPVHKAMSGALDGLALRESLIAGNLANIDTPGYVPQSVSFEGALHEALASDAARAAGGSAVVISGGMVQTDPRHLGPGGTTAGAEAPVNPFAGSIRNDGNQVDLESEMAALAETQLRFSAVGRLMTTHLGMLRDAITGGR